jgi:hypothetical protein
MTAAVVFSVELRRDAIVSRSCRFMRPSCPKINVHSTQQFFYFLHHMHDSYALSLLGTVSSFNELIFRTVLQDIVIKCQETSSALWYKSSNEAVQTISRPGLE